MPPTFYSDHLSSDGISQTTVDVQKRISAGVGGGRIRYKRAAWFSVNTADGDVIRIAQFSTADRILQLFVDVTAGGARCTGSVGLHQSNARHEGAVVDDNLFESAADWSSAVARTDVFQGAALVGIDRGKRLYELAGQTTDPMENWDLTVTTPGGTATTTTIDGVVEVYFISGP